IGTAILLLSPLIFAALRIPQSFAITILIGLTIMLTSVVMYAAILPEEWDASFNKALPILTQGEYISAEETHAVKRILKACALTYVAAALADMLSLWRWLLILRR
ncbi:MAG: zinc metallopeptidase, partial [Gammaproteobacteria bacterium]|nr:zinc metallopeptidase [Gammaproteobacteria bacterium]